MSQIEHPPVREAMDTLRRISDDELKQLHALARKRALMDQADLIDEARTEGAVNTRIQMLTRQLTVRFGPLPEATVERLRSGTAEDHERWAERLLTAASLDAVFLPPGDA